MRRILIIEDDWDIGYVVDVVLSVTYETMVLRSADGIVKVYKQFRPDLIIIDNFIARRRAADIIAELRLEEEGVLAPFILFSAAINIAQLARDMHAAAYLSKPFDLSDLTSVVDTVINNLIDNR